MLVTSRLQRDLTDSSTQRNIGVAFGHSLLAIDNVTRGPLPGLDVDANALARDLDASWEVLGEPIQQAMRVASIKGATGMDNPYERLKDLTRGQQVTEEIMRDFIKSLGIPADVEARLLELTPATYTGTGQPARYLPGRIMDQELTGIAGWAVDVLGRSAASAPSS